MDRNSLPPRMFAAGEEPVGERINSYHKIKKTELITDALEPEELEFLRNSTFAIRGYVDAIQLVLIAAVPKLKEEITQDDPVVIDESESDGETPDVVGDLGYLTVSVKSIIEDPNVERLVEQILIWSMKQRTWV
ncbi:hypothetical protein F2Q68_00014849 [Brassica cretica]|uniref:Uncharacterized protein n=1 Tax=Brassica cretica TaxID=69181 RepID=A0A8S9HE76_BRACR|nr:hypothetical protein F2Q68_00014849 [Brassica cretica]